MADSHLTIEHRIGTPYFIVPSCTEYIVKNAEDGVTRFVVRHYNLARNKYEYTKKNVCSAQYIWECCFCSICRKLAEKHVEIKCQLDATDDFYCRFYCLLNMFRAPLCPSSGAREYYTSGCCLWYLVLWLCVPFAGCSQQTGHTTLSSTPYRQLENQSTKYHRAATTCIIISSSWWWA